MEGDRNELRWETPVREIGTRSNLTMKESPSVHTGKSGFLLGYDIGTSTIKASVLDIASGRPLGSATAPQVEMAIKSAHDGFAEQDPEDWWTNLRTATAALRETLRVDLRAVQAIGITYQMHGLVLVDKNLSVLRPSIIWCDSRAVDIGNRARLALGDDLCRRHLLNSPANFTAAKIRWVMENEPEVHSRAWKAMLPGDYIAARMTGEVTTTAGGLSEMTLWDFEAESPARRLMEYFEISPDLLPTLVPTFGVQGRVSKRIAKELGLNIETPVTYRTGDQSNNAFSLNVLEPGELAATAGTSGVVYGIVNSASCDLEHRVNTFLHVNHRAEAPRLGILMCVNGCGILNSWCRHQFLGRETGYDEMNQLASTAPLGCERLTILPYGNGAERTLGNRIPGASIHGLSFHVHERSHILRAAQEGIVFALNYGLEIMKRMGLSVETIRAGHANLFRSPLFAEMFASVTGATVEVFETDGAEGAARGAGVGLGAYHSLQDAFSTLNVLTRYEPDVGRLAEYQAVYNRWRSVLERNLDAMCEQQQ
jgi:xylulokinase